MTNLLLSLLFLFVYSVVLKPIFKLRFYKAQGIETYYFPLFGLMKTYLSDVEKNGDFFHFVLQKTKEDPNIKCWATNLSSKTVLHVADNLMLKDFYGRHEVYKKSKDFMGTFYDLMDNGMLVTEGQKWKTQRRTVSSVFHYDFLKENTPLIQKICIDHLDKLAQKKDLTNYQVGCDFQEIMGDIMGKLFFGNDMSKYEVEGEVLARALPHVVEDCFAVNNDPFRLLFGTGYIRLGLTAKHRSVLRRIKKCQAAIMEIAKDRKKKTKAGAAFGKDLLGVMLQKQAEEGEELWPDIEIAAQAITFFLGGVDTTSHALTMGFYLLNQHPEYIDKLMAEVNSHYYSQNIAIDDLQKMELMQAFMKETLRLYSPGKTAFMREVVADHKIGDVKVRKGDLVWPILHSNDLNEKYYEDPWKFKPERWIEKTLAGGIPTYHFAGGARNCIGQHLSNIESKILFAEFLKRFEIKVSDGYKLKMTLRMAFEPLEAVRFDIKVKQPI